MYLRFDSVLRLLWVVMCGFTQSLINFATQVRLLYPPQAGLGTPRKKPRILTVSVAVTRSSLKALSLVRIQDGQLANAGKRLHLYELLLQG